MHMFGTPVNTDQRIQLQPVNPPARQEMERKVVEMASTLLPPPLDPELSLEQRQRMDIVSLQEYSNHAYQ